MLSGRCLSSQSATQPPANYQGPTLWGVCVYIIGDTSYYSNIFSTSGYYKFKAQQAFHDYATTQAKGVALKGSGCRWSTSQEEVTTQKAADKKLLGLAGRSAKGMETGWVFTAAATPATTTAASRASNATSAGATQRAAYTNGAANQAGAQSAAGTGSIASSTQQTMQDSLATSKATAAGAVNDTVATTMGTVSSGANNAIKGLFNRKPKAAADPQSTTTANSPQTPGAAPAVNGQQPAPLGMENTQSPQVATAEAQHIEGIVADVAGSDIIVNVGTQAGVRVGTKFAVMHAVRTVKDPSTGKVLRTIEDKVGELTIQNADATSAAGVFSGATPAKVGDTVRLPSTQ